MYKLWIWSLWFQVTIRVEWIGQNFNDKWVKWSKSKKYFSYISNKIIISYNLSFVFQANNKPNNGTKSTIGTKSLWSNF